jgi:hypothetical protein
MALKTMSSMTQSGLPCAAFSLASFLSSLLNLKLDLSKNLFILYIGRKEVFCFSVWGRKDYSQKRMPQSTTPPQSSGVCCFGKVFVSGLIPL